MKALLLLLLFWFTHAAEVIVWGDSWAVFANSAINDLFSSKGVTVHNAAQNGATTTSLSAEPDGLKKVVDQHPDAKYVWVIVGGNDIRNGLASGKTTDVVAASIVNNTRAFLDPLFAAYPDIQVVQTGYDFVRWNITQSCFQLYKLATLPVCGQTPTIECQNTVFLGTMDVYESISAFYPKHHSVNLYGSLQAAGGIQGAAPGSPVMTEMTPAKYMSTDCIHLTSAGSTAFIRALWDEFFEKEYQKDGGGKCYGKVRVNSMRCSTAMDQEACEGGGMSGLCKWEEAVDCSAFRNKKSCEGAYCVYNKKAGICQDFDCSVTPDGRPMQRRDLCEGYPTKCFWNRRETQKSKKCRNIVDVVCESITVRRNCVNDLPHCEWSSSASPPCTMIAE